MKVLLLSCLMFITSMAQTVLKVGVILPQDENLGVLKALADEHIAAIRVAMDMINLSDDYDVTMEMQVEDSGHPEDDTALNNALDAVVNTYGCQAILGALTSSKTKKIAEALASSSYPAVAQVSASATSNQLSNAFEYPSFFRTAPNDDAQVEAMIALLTDLNVEKVGLIYTTDSYAGSLAETFYQRWIAEGKMLSPAWANTPNFAKGDANQDNTAQNAIRIIKEQGDAAYNLICVGETNDVEELMRAANSQGMIGGGYVWVGFDMFSTTVNSGSPEDLIQIYDGAIATSLKYATVTNPLFLDFTSHWSQMVADGNVDVTSVPWAGESNVLSLFPFTAQMYDAVAILAQAVTNWVRDGNTGTITRYQLIEEMKANDLQTPGIGNVDRWNIFSFDTSQGGYDGFQSYEILNWVGDQWAAVGDWKSDVGYQSFRAIFFPGGTTVTPPDERPTSYQPSVQPSDQPSGQPSDQPTMEPSVQPSLQPTDQPSRQPSCITEDCVNLKIGVILPQIEYEGTLKSLVDQAIDAIKVAISMINASPDYKVNMTIDGLVRDSGESVEEGIIDTHLNAVVDELVNNPDVNAIIGALYSSKSIKVATRLAGAVAQVSASSTSNQLSNKDVYPSFFRTAPNDNAQADAMIALLEHFGIEKVGLIYTTDPYAGGLAETFMDRWLAKGYVLSPDRDSTPKYSKGQIDATAAAAAIDTILNEGTAAYNLISAAETNDVEALMREAHNRGMIGNGYVWGGFDVFRSTAEFNTDLMQIFDGTFCTNVKYPSYTNPLFLDFAAAWMDLAVANEVAWVPNMLDLYPYTAQMYDAVAIIAQAATNWVNAGNSGVISRSDLIDAMKDSALATPGIGNIDIAGMFWFDQSFNGYDGFQSYDILNWVVGKWDVVGDWKWGGGLRTYLPLFFFGGTTAVPPANRPDQPSLNPTTGTPSVSPTSDCTKEDEESCDAKNHCVWHQFKCMSQCNAFEGIAVIGVVLDYFSSPNVQYCQDKCQDDPKCWRFSFLLLEEDQIQSCITYNQTSYFIESPDSTSGECKYSQEPTFVPSTSHPSQRPSSFPTASVPSQAPTSSSPSQSPSLPPTTEEPSYIPSVSPSAAPSQSPVINCAAIGSDVEICERRNCTYYDGTCVNSCLRSIYYLEASSTSDEHLNFTVTCEAFDRTCEMHCESRCTSATIANCYAYTLECEEPPRNNPFGVQDLHQCSCFLFRSFSATQDVFTGKLLFRSRICWRPDPTKAPSFTPTLCPTFTPTTDPSQQPSVQPTTSFPSKQPSQSIPTEIPSTMPSFQPSHLPSWSSPTEIPTPGPTTNPTPSPTRCYGEGTECTGMSKCLNIEVGVTISCEICETPLQFEACCKCGERTGGYQNLLLNQTRMGFLYREGAFDLPSQVSSDVHFRMDQTAWSISLWIRGVEGTFKVMKACYDEVCDFKDLLHIDKRKLYWTHVDLHGNETKLDLLPDTIWDNENVGHHIFIVHHHMNLIVYLNGERRNSMIVRFGSPDVLDKRISIGEEGNSFEIGSFNYYFKPIREPQLLSTYYENEASTWIIEEDDCPYCLSMGDIRSLWSIGLSVIGTLLLACAISYGYNKCKSLAPAQFSFVLVFGLAVLSHISDIAFVFSVTLVDYPYGFLGLMLLASRLIGSAFYYMWLMPGWIQWQILLLVASGGHLEAVCRFMNSGFLADYKYFTTKVHFEPLLGGSYVVFRLSFLFIFLAYESYQIYDQGLDVLVIVSFVLSLCLVVYKLFKQIFASTEFVYLAVIPAIDPIEENLINYSNSYKLCKAFPDFLNKEVIQVKQIVQVNNSVVTWVRLEVRHLQHEEMNKEELKYALLAVYEKLFGKESENKSFSKEKHSFHVSDNQGGGLENITKKLHNAGFWNSDRLLKPGGSAFKGGNRKTFMSESEQIITDAGFIVEKEKLRESETKKRDPDKFQSEEPAETNLDLNMDSASLRLQSLESITSNSKRSFGVQMTDIKE